MDEDKEAANEEEFAGNYSEEHYSEEHYSEEGGVNDKTVQRSQERTESREMSQGRTESREMSQADEDVKMLRGIPFELTPEGRLTARSPPESYDPIIATPLRRFLNQANDGRLSLVPIGERPVHAANFLRSLGLRYGPTFGEVDVRRHIPTIRQTQEERRKLETPDVPISIGPTDEERDIEQSIQRGRERFGHQLSRVRLPQPVSQGPFYPQPPPGRPPNDEPRHLARRRALQRPIEVPDDDDDLKKPTRQYPVGEPQGPQRGAGQAAPPPAGRAPAAQPVRDYYNNLGQGLKNTVGKILAGGATLYGVYKGFTPDSETPEKIRVYTPEQEVANTPEQEVVEIPRIVDRPRVADRPRVEDIPDVPRIADRPRVEDIPDVPRIADRPRVGIVPEGRQRVEADNIRNTALGVIGKDVKKHAADIANKLAGGVGSRIAGGVTNPGAASIPRGVPTPRGIPTPEGGPTPEGRETTRLVMPNIVISNVQQNPTTVTTLGQSILPRLVGFEAAYGLYRKQSRVLGSLLASISEEEARGRKKRDKKVVKAVKQAKDKTEKAVKTEVLKIKEKCRLQVGKIEHDLGGALGAYLAGSLTQRAHNFDLATTTLKSLGVI